jgi:hypothetical protein
MKNYFTILIAIVALILIPASLFAQWSQMYSSNSSGNTNSVVYTIGSTVLQGSSTGLSISTNNGTTWNGATYAPNGLAFVWEGVRSFTQMGNIVFAGTSKGGVLFSTDNGATWTRATNNGIPNNTTGIYKSPVNALLVSGSKLIAGNDSGVYVTSNNGTTWTKTSTGLPSQTGIFSLAKHGTSIFAVTGFSWGTGLGLVYKSVNDGASWSPVTIPLQYASPMTSLAVLGTSIFVGNEGLGIYKSSDDGVTWSKLTSFSYCQKIISFATNSNTLFVGTSPCNPMGGVFVSYDNGDNWAVIAPNSSSAPNVPCSIGLNNNYIFASTPYGEVYRTQMPVGLNEQFKESELTFYPNPTNEQVTINFGNYATMSGYTLKITNAMSQIVFTSTIYQQQLQIDLTNWTGYGIYFVHLIDAQNNTIDIKKLVLQ